MSHAPTSLPPQGDDHAKAPPLHVTPDELNEISAQVLGDPGDGRRHKDFVVDGWFVDPPDFAHPGDKVWFRDDDGETNLLQVSARLLSEVLAGEPVRLFGNLRLSNIGGERVCLLEVNTVVRGGRQANATAQRIYQQLCKLRHDPVPFPSERPLRITLVAPLNGVAHEDFRKAVSRVKDKLQIDVKYVPIRSTYEVAEAIRQAQGHVVAVVRGGGDDDLSVFDAPQVLYAMAAKQAYRLAGIGHAPDRRLIDLVVDHAADVPATAGEFIREQIELAEQAAVAQAESTDLRERLATQLEARVLAEHRLQLEQAQSQQAREALAQAEQRLREAELARAQAPQPQVIERLVPILPPESEWPVADQQATTDLQARVADLRWRLRALSVAAVLLVIAATAGWVKFAQSQRREAASAAAAAAALAARAEPALPARHPAAPRHR